MPSSSLRLTGAQAGKRLAEVLRGESVWAFVSPYRRTRETMRHAFEQCAPPPPPPTTPAAVTQWRACRLEARQIHQIREDPRLREQEFAGGFQTQKPDTSTRLRYGACAAAQAPAAAAAAAA